MSTSRADPLLVVENLSAPPFGNSPPLWAGVSFTVKPSTILCLRGPSGSGKSVLLKCLAHLLVYPTGTIHLSGQSPTDLGVPVWRSKVLYLPQRPALLPGTPNEFWETLKGFKSRKGRDDLGDPWKIAAEWGIARPQWDQTWGSLSGGEGQRIALAVALALKPTVLLLDEPTSALDSNAAALVEDTLLRTSLGGRQTCVWVTHSDEQAARVATETFDLTAHLQAEV